MLGKLKDIAGAIACSCGFHDPETVPGSESDKVIRKISLVNGEVKYSRRGPNPSPIIWSSTYRPAKKSVCLRCGECFDEEAIGLKEIEKREAEERRVAEEKARRARIAEDLWIMGSCDD